MVNKPIDHLRELILHEQKAKFPSMPEKYLRINDFSKDKPEKKEKKRIEKFLNLIGGCRGTIIEVRGTRKDNRETVTDVLGRQKVIGSIEWTGSGMRRGIADIQAVIKGMAVDIELKRIYKKGKDKQSEFQKEEERKMNEAGGEYWIVDSFEHFYQKFMNFKK